MHNIRINQGRVIMWQFRVAGTLLVFFIGAWAFLNLSEFLAVSIFIAASFLLPALWSSYHIFEVNPSGKFISEYYWISGLKAKKEVIHFSAIDKIFINQVKMAQNYQTFLGTPRTYKSMEYHAFLKLADGNKFFMTSDSNPDKLRKKLLPIAEKLKCDLVENF